MKSQTLDRFLWKTDDIKIHEKTAADSKEERLDKNVQVSAQKNQVKANTQQTT